MLNVDLKILSKALSENLKEHLPDLISSQQTAYVKNRHIGESGRLISDVKEITKRKNIEGFLVTMDIGKAFDSLDHNFLISTLEKYAEAVVQRCSVKKGVLRNLTKFTDKHLCVSLFFNEVAGHKMAKHTQTIRRLCRLLPTNCLSVFDHFVAFNFIKIEALAQMFSCEFCKISKSPFLHRTPLVVASEYGIRQNFILWIKILLKDQESCLSNGGKTTKYFLLGRGAHQGDPISTFLFVLALAISFLLTKTKPEIAGLTIFDHCYLYSAYVNDTTFFVKDTISLKNMVDTFHFFSDFSGLKPLSKCENAGFGVLKEVHVTDCGMRCIDLNNDTLKILGTHFSYNQKLKEERNFYISVTNIQRVQKYGK